MCGILGVIGSEPDGLAKGVESGLGALSHRGPDAHAA